MYDRKTLLLFLLGYFSAASCDNVIVYKRNVDSDENQKCARKNVFIHIGLKSSVESVEPEFDIVEQLEQKVADLLVRVDSLEAFTEEKKRHAGYLGKVIKIIGGDTVSVQSWEEFNTWVKTYVDQMLFFCNDFITNLEACNCKGRTLALVNFLHYAQDPRYKRILEHQAYLTQDATMKLNKTIVVCATVENSLYGADVCNCPASPRHCDDVYDDGNSDEGVYEIFTGDRFLQVYCEFQKNGYNWMVFQRRTSDEVSFFRNWKNYTDGFGDVTGNVWLGLDNLYHLTRNTPYILRIEFEDFLGTAFSLEFGSLVIGDAHSKYKLTYGEIKALTSAFESLVPLETSFSTYDQDNDLFAAGPCARVHLGGWWYGNWDGNTCTVANLNGEYKGNTRNKGVRRGEMFWLKNNFFESLKSAKMKIRPQ